MVAVLLKTTRHEEVNRLLSPIEAVKRGVILDEEANQLIKETMTDIIVYARKAPHYRCHFIEQLMPEFVNLNIDQPSTASSMRLFSYINREFDTKCYSTRPCVPDMSLNRCPLISHWILYRPSRGQSNTCKWDFNLLLVPNEASFNLVKLHLAQYMKKNNRYENHGSCQVTWFSQVFGTIAPRDIAPWRSKLWNEAKRLPQEPSLRKKRSDDEDQCSKPKYLCSQTTEVTTEVQHQCIYKVMGERLHSLGKSSVPAFTDCGEQGTAEAELLPLMNFDNSDEHETEDPMATGTISNADVILSRAGFFSRTHDLQQTKVCHKHSVQYGQDGFKNYIMKKALTTIRRKLETKCLFPETQSDAGHALGPVKANPRTYLNKDQAEAIFRYEGVIVPVGLPVCKKHWTTANLFLAKYTLQQDESFPEGQQSTSNYQLRQRSDVWYQESSSQSQPFSLESPIGSLGASQEMSKSCPLPETPLERIRRLLKVFTTENLVSYWHETDSYSTKAESTKYKYRLASRGATKLINYALVGEEQNILEEDIRKAAQASWDNGEVAVENILKNVQLIYHSLESHLDRKIVLGVIALSTPYRLISRYIDGITHYQYTASRSVARQYAVNEEPLPPPAIGKMRLDKQKVDVFIEYIIDNMTPLPYGTKEKKTSCGKKIVLPPYLSVIRKKKQIKEFVEYLKQTERRHLLMSRATYYRILNVLSSAIRYRKSTSGLDYKTNNALEAFDKLETTVCRLKEIGSIDQDEETALLNSLTNAKSYLRGDYKYHVRQASTVGDHCSTFSLSDVTNTKLRSTCDHEHDAVCQRCEAVKVVLRQLKTIIEETSYDNEREKLLTADLVQKCIQDVEEYKKHQLRTVHQSNAKSSLLSVLRPNQVLIVADYAMKWLPTAGREDQTSFFGKKGLSWHISYVIRKLENGELMYRIIQHVFSKQNPQDSAAVTAIFNDTLKRLHEEDPVLEEAFVRTDNAGCYHSAKMMSAITQLNTELPMKVKRWDFSEVQSGMKT